MRLGARGGGIAAALRYRFDDSRVNAGVSGPEESYPLTRGIYRIVDTFRVFQGIGRRHAQSRAVWGGAVQSRRGTDARQAQKQGWVIFPTECVAADLRIESRAQFTGRGF